MIVNVQIAKAENNWTAFSTPDAINCLIAVTGDTRDEAIANFRDALADMLSTNSKAAGVSLENIELDLHETVPAVGTRIVR